MPSFNAFTVSGLNQNPSRIILENTLKFGILMIYTMRVYQYDLKRRIDFYRNY